MRVLVTGHLGYIGTVLTPLLLARGHDVRGLDADLYRECTFGEGAGEIVHVPWTCKDVRDATLQDVAGFDAVLHLAGLSNDPLGDLDPELTFAINYEASVRLAELAKEAGAERFVFSSSCSNYGAGSDDLLDEDAPFNPVTPYGESKVLVEDALGPMADDGFSPVSLRNATAYGASPRIRFDLVVNNLTAWAHTTGDVHLKSDGRAWRPLVHIRDIAQAFAAVLEAPREAIHDQAFNVGRTEENYRIRDVADIVGEVVPDSVVAYAEGASRDKRNYRVSCEKAERALPGFRPEWTVRKGVEELYTAYQRHGVELAEFEGPRYKRIAHIQRLQQEGLLGPDFRRTATREEAA